MPSYNRVMLMGNLTRDPELKYIPSGAAVCNMGMATNRTRVGKETGEKIDEATFINFECWGKQAENCAKYLHKGSPVFIEGRLKSSSWETEAGKKRTKLEVVADRVQFMSSKKKVEESRDQAGEESQVEPTFENNKVVNPPEGEEDTPF